jgi:hypothetical protein
MRAMSTDPISGWLAAILTELGKEAAKSGARAFAKWLDGARGEEVKALHTALPLALDDFARYSDKASAERFRKFLRERQATNDTAFGDAMLRALLVDPRGIVALSPQLQSRIAVDLQPAALEFLSHFHRRLWSQSPFDKLLQAETSQQIVAALQRISPSPDFASAEREYLAQLIERTELLEFVGIPDPRQNAAIKLEDIFVPLGAEEEIETEPFILDESRLGFASASLTIWFCKWFQQVTMVIGTHALHQFSSG